MMTSALFRSPRALLAVAVLLALCGAAALSPLATARADGGDPGQGSASDGGSVGPASDWVSPVLPFRLQRPFVAPPHEYGPGHRGIDLEVVGDDVVRAPAAGIVAFAGQVAGRGILTIDHGDGLVSTLEPVVTELLPGARVAAAAPVGWSSTGGHTAAGSVHFGVRLDGAYINPMVLLGAVPRAVLLPCC